MAAPTFRTPAALHWLRDGARVLLVDEPSGKVRTLTGLDAALWSWLCLRYRGPDLLALVQAWLREPEAQARAYLDQRLDNWVELGILQAEEPV